MGVRASFGAPAAAVPGQVARCQLEVENTGEGVEDVRVELLGQAGAWGWATPAALTLPPGAVETVTVTFKLPRDPQPAAGPLPITASVTIAGDRLAPVTTTGTLDVAAFVDIVASVRPHTSRGPAVGRHRLSVENRGNVALSATVEGGGDGVAVLVEPGRLHVGPGQAAEAEVTVRPGRRRFRGGATTLPFAVVVQPDGPGAETRAEGAVELRTSGGTVWAGRVAAGVLVLALAGVALRATGAGPGVGPSPATTRATASPAGAPAASQACPGRDHVSPDANGIVRSGVTTPFDYSFLFVSGDGCRPARFNPCAPVRYVLNRALATDADVADLDGALAKVSAATGLEFEFAGTSGEDPRNTARPVRGADGKLGWPPVLIGWAHLGAGDELRQRAASPATTQAPSPATKQAADPGVVGGGGRPIVSQNVITTGNLVLNLDAVTDTDTHDPVPHGFGPGVNWGRIMMHELAHVIGLGHVQSRTSIMNETLTQQTISSSEWGVGDLIGLRDLGREGGCLTVPPLQVQGTPPS